MLDFFNLVDPPFIDSISKYFSVKNMKLKRTVSVVKIQPKYPQNFLMTTPNFVEQPDNNYNEETKENSDYPTNNNPKGFYDDSSENRVFAPPTETGESKSYKHSSIKSYESPDFVQRTSQNMINSFKKDEHFEIKVKETPVEEAKHVNLLKNI